MPSLIPTHACEGEELAMSLGLSLALDEGCLYVLLREDIADRLREKG